MVETAKNVLLILSALFPIVNPLGGSPVFLALTRDYPTSARRALARQVAVNSFILLIASFMVGTHILNFFGISIPVVQVGGGLVVVSNGWAMLKQKEEPDRGRDVQRLRGGSRHDLCLLRLCRPHGCRDWRKRHGDRPAALLLSLALHWRADHVEWRERPGALSRPYSSLIPWPGQP